MTNNDDQHSALSWVKNGIVDILDDSRIALTAFRQDTSNVVQLRFCITYFRQLVGALKMLELLGGELLSEEMLALACHVDDDRLSDPNDSIDTLLQAIHVFPDYLKQVEVSNQDQPLRLLTTLNDLRSARQQPPLSELELFSPDLDITLPEEIRPIENLTTDIQQIAGKLKPVFQAGLLQWLDDRKEELGLQCIAVILRELEQNSSSEELIKFWWINRALIEALLDGGLQSTREIQQHIKRLDKFIACLNEDGENAAETMVSSSLLHTLLYHIAIAESANELVNQVRNAFQLPSLSNQSGIEVTYHGGELRQSISEALLEEIRIAKELLLASERTPVKLNQMRNVMGRITQILQLLSVPKASQILKKQQHHLNKLTNSNEIPTSDDFNALANALLQLESELLGTPISTKDAPESHLFDESPVSGQALDDAKLALFKESLIELSSIQRCIVSFYDHTGSVKSLRHLPNDIKLFSTRLQMAGLDNCASILDACYLCIQYGLEDIDDDITPFVVDRLSQAIAAIDLYIEGLVQNGMHRHVLLSTAKECIDPLVNCLPGRPSQDNNEIVSDIGEDTDDTDKNTINLEHHPDWLAPVAKWSITSSADPEIVHAFLEESVEEIGSIENNIEHWQQNPDNPEVLGNIRRSFHTLKGSGRVAGANNIGDFSWSIEHLLNQVLDDAIELTDKLIDIIIDATHELTKLINQFVHGVDNLEPSSLVIIQKAESLGQYSDTNTDIEERGQLFVIFQSEAAQQIQQLMEYLVECAQSTEHHLSNEIGRILHTLKGSSRIAGVETFANAITIIEQLVKQHITHRQPIDEQSLYKLQQITSELGNYISGITQSTLIPDLPAELLNKLESFTSLSSDIPEYDEELLISFIEEMEEIQQSCNEALDGWHKKPGELRYAAALQRELHTLKGGARLVGITTVADLAHHLETLLTPFADGMQSVKPGLHPLVNQCLEIIDESRQHLQSRISLPAIGNLMIEIDTFIGSSAPIQSLDILSKDIGAPQPEKAGAENILSEQIRVSAEQLDMLSNLGGEINLSTGRIYQETLGLRSSLTEMGETTERLRQQLRRLELETDAKILFRHEDNREQSKDFDPLEMDRYSQLQQLSRALSESVSDLQDLHITMNDVIRRGDISMMQQSRSNRQMGQTLLGIRMLPFDHLRSRLEKLVSQTAEDLEKKVRLDITAGELRMDRSVLQRITSSLEHILRNAIAHGIEAPVTRRQANKDELGNISIQLRSSGTDITLAITDDGRGIDMQGIRNTACSKGLLQSNKDYSDDELLQHILASGFSTADRISAISGRGYGLDVVNTTVKNLGGTLTILSEEGVGTTFTLRLPISLSTTRAMLVKASGHNYGIPLGQIENIIRLNKQQIQTLLATDNTEFNYQEKTYQFHSMTRLFYGDASPRLPERHFLPLILIHSGDLNIALLPDTLIGNREIVVKNVGPQIASLPEIAGATLTDDGNVALMLDIPTLVRRRQQARSSLTETSTNSTVKRTTPLIMVVDDSITMRKAAQNLLRRHDMDVVSAKDGVEAVTLLNEQLPDVILLDIEMPRMDGYEFASIVRNNDRFRDLPIIMITSRTGEKHRRRAEQFNIHAYLGKPYQETELMQHIQELLKAGAEQ